MKLLVINKWIKSIIKTIEIDWFNNYQKLKKTNFLMCLSKDQLIFQKMMQTQFTLLNLNLHFNIYLVCNKWILMESLNYHQEKPTLFLRIWIQWTTMKKYWIKKLQMKYIVLIFLIFILISKKCSRKSRWNIIDYFQY